MTVVGVGAEITRAFDAVPPTRQAAQRSGQGLLSVADVLGFWVPSAVVPTEPNLVLNPRCEHFAQLVSVRETYVLPVDRRLAR